MTRRYNEIHAIKGTLYFAVGSLVRSCHADLWQAAEKVNCLADSSEPVENVSLESVIKRFAAHYRTTTDLQWCHPVDKPVDHLRFTKEQEERDVI